MEYFADCRDWLGETLRLDYLLHSYENVIQLEGVEKNEKYRRILAAGTREKRKMVCSIEEHKKDEEKLVGKMKRVLVGVWQLKCRLRTLLNRLNIGGTSQSIGSSESALKREREKIRGSNCELYISSETLCSRFNFQQLFSPRDGEHNLLLFIFFTALSKTLSTDFFWPTIYSRFYGSLQCRHVVFLYSTIFPFFVPQIGSEIFFLTRTRRDFIFIVFMGM